MLAVVAAALATWGNASTRDAPRATDPRSTERLLRYAMTVPPPNREACCVSAQARPPSARPGQAARPEGAEATAWTSRTTACAICQGGQWWGSASSGSGWPRSAPAGGSPSSSLPAGSLSTPHTRAITLQLFLTAFFRSRSWLSRTFPGTRAPDALRRLYRSAPGPSLKSDGTNVCGSAGSLCTASSENPTDLVRASTLTCLRRRPRIPVIRLAIGAAVWSARSAEEKERSGGPITGGDAEAARQMAAGTGHRG